MANYDPDYWYFKQLDQQPIDAAVTSIPGGSVPAWQCDCFHWNHITVPSCNNCGLPRKEEVQ